MLVDQAEDTDYYGGDWQQGEDERGVMEQQGNAPPHTRYFTSFIFF